ncbi:probable membrane-associated kinase regulator 1 [Impatiens glandulifera]|uniref:probable membrane-associated kinase regulator 1 n=1 Tax=Impatiens glandulifera TaxID=253017 RepID=UPI001FB062B0|nr:probable membrane-associated kinase regulator 1 [Impatiens glandulifera]
MDRKTSKPHKKSQTLPSSPTHIFKSPSSTSPDFEFAVTLSPRKSAAGGLCPADDLFYKGKLLPLHVTPRLSMVQTILLSSSSSSSSSNFAASRDSTVSRSSNESARTSFSSDVNLIYSTNIESARSSSVTGDDEVKRISKKNKYSLSRLTSVFKNEPKHDSKTTRSSEKRVKGKSAKEMILKYLKKVKPFCEKMKPHEHGIKKTGGKDGKGKDSFSGDLIYTRRKTMSGTCLSSPIHHHHHHDHRGNENRHVKSCSDIPSSSSMEELQNSIQGAIVHCKNSMKIDGGRL